MGLLERIRDMIGKGGMRIRDLEAAAVDAPSNGGGRGMGRDGPSRNAATAGIVVTEEYRAVLAALEAGAPIVFVSGRAGSGKSTLIPWLLEQLDWPAAIVAPTGIAALTIGGSTIHSFFRFPPRLLEPDDVKRVTDRKLYEKLRLLVVDEISMVRADVMDAVCRFLEINGPRPGQPHGGVQLLLVGDLFQLPPVVDQRDVAQFFRRIYRSPHFFSAKAFESARLVPVELEHIFRQRDPEFTALLNDIREGKNVESAVAVLNARCAATSGADDTAADRGAVAPASGPVSESSAQRSRPVVTLTPTNKAADDRNTSALAALPGPVRLYPGRLEGRFDPEKERLPSPMNLELKVGAQVMFTKNDRNHLWVNGTLGVVRELGAELVRVELAPDRGGTHDDGGGGSGGGAGGTVVDVAPVSWEKIRYRWNESEQRIEKELIGRYVQLPLMLAWATTIHKAQGQTLDSVEIDFGRGAFACGQAYVALSRCRELAGVRLTRPLRPDDIQCDPEVVRFHEALRKSVADGAH